MRLEKDYLNWAAEASTSTRQYGHTLKAINPGDNVLSSLAYLCLVNQWSMQSTWKRCMQASRLTFSPALKSDDRTWLNIRSTIVAASHCAYLSCRWHNSSSPSLIPADHRQTISTEIKTLWTLSSPRSRCRQPSCSCGWRWRAPPCSWTAQRRGCFSSWPDCEPRRTWSGGQHCPVCEPGSCSAAQGTSSADREESYHRNHKSLQSTQFSVFSPCIGMFAEKLNFMEKSVFINVVPLGKIRAIKPIERNNDVDKLERNNNDMFGVDSLFTIVYRKYSYLKHVD